MKTGNDHPLCGVLTLVGWQVPSDSITPPLSKTGQGKSKVEKLPKSWVKIQAVEKGKAYV